MSRVITESDVSGLFANLSAGLIGSMITVFYIEIVQRYHEEARWKNVDHLIAEEVVAAASGAIAQIEAVICRHFGITSDRIIMEVGEGIIVQDSTIDEQYMSFIEENVICRLDEALQEFADEEWNLLSSSLSRIYDEFETLQNLYQERLEPEQLARIQKNRTTSRGVRDTIQAKLWSTDLLISLTAPRVEALLRSSMVLVRDNWSSAWPSRTQRVGSKTQF